MGVGYFNFDFIQRGENIKVNNDHFLPDFL